MGDLKKLLDKYGRCIEAFGTVTLYPPVICKDGYFMSIQASKFHHCEPKETLKTFDYDTVEVRCLEDDATELTEYEGNDKKFYYNVPVEVIENIIKKHGGIDEQAVVDIILKKF